MREQFQKNRLFLIKILLIDFFPQEVHLIHFSHIMSKVFHSVVSFLSTQYRGMVAKKLSSYGKKNNLISIFF